MSKSKDSFLDSLMMGLGKQLGKRRRDVHKAIDRFQEEVNQDDPPPAKPVAEAETPKAETDSTAEEKPADN